ncbi:MAG: hypothetical protein KF764_08170 [Labilithrix sp.]|nr:hypothetical protein [Labilithrix sp.]
MRKAFVVFFVGSFVALVACGGGKGDSCDEEGRVGGECDEGLVCGKAKNDNSGELICLKQCNTQVDCGGGEDCNGVGKTSLKGCRPR